MMLSKFRDGLKAVLCEPVVALAVLLACLGVWILLPEIIRTGTSISADKVAQSSLSQGGALRVVAASRIALIRGDLWAEAAKMFDGVVRAADAGADKAVLESAKERLATACRNALSLSPISSDLWALCAPYCGDRKSSSCVTRYIQMAYFTGPYRLESIPDRLRTAMTVDFNENPDLKMLVAEDIRFILRQNPALRPDLTSSYRNAMPSNKPVILALITEIDSSFAATLR